MLLVTQPPQGSDFDFDPLLYSQPEFLKLIGIKNPTSFFVYSQKKNLLKLRIHFVIRGSVMVSGEKAPFGSFEVSKDLDRDIFVGVVQNLVQMLKKDHNVSGMEIRHYPRIYDPEPLTNLSAILAQNGFQISHSQMNHHLDLSKPFEQELHRMETRKLDRSRDQNFDFDHPGVDHLTDIYDFIQSCRTERQQDLSLDYSDLESMIKTFPNNYFLFAVKQKDRLVAATIVVKVNKQVIYNFCPASSKQQNRSSPIVFLLKNIHEFFRKRRCRYLDLGTSEVNGAMKKELSRFKDRLGAGTSLKYTFVKEFNS